MLRRQLRQQTKLDSNQLEDCKDQTSQTRPSHPLNSPGSASQDEDSDDMDVSTLPPSSHPKSRLSAPHLQGQLSRLTDRSLASAERRFCHTVLCGTWEEPPKRLVTNLAADFCGPLFLQDCVAVNLQDVVDAADSQSLPMEGKFCL